MGYQLDPSDPRGWKYVEDGPIQYGGATDWPGPPPYIPARIDGWCEDRTPGVELTDEDGID